jgi:predicted DNA-binding transcriptional regulator YafY
MIALLGRFRREGSEPLEDLAESLGMSAEELASDLSTLSMCGVAPYYPDQMVDVFVEDGLVMVYSPVPAVPSHVRLSTSEARALIAALQMAGFADDDALVTRLLDANAVDVDAGELRRRIAPSVAQHDGATFALLADAIGRHRVAVIEHVSGHTPGPAAQRTIEPLALFGDRGAWYVQSFCRSAGGMRTFRLDRIESVRVLDEQFPHHSEVVPQTSAFEPAGLPLATLEFDAEERFDEREWPGATDVHRSEDRTVVNVPYSGTAWIARQVVSRLGGVRVTAPDEVRAAVVSLAEDLTDQLRQEGPA